MIIQFDIPGNPIARKRPRFARRGSFVQTYSIQETEEGRMLWEIKQQLPDTWVPLQRPISTTIVFYMARPKGHYGTGKNEAQLKKNAPSLHVSKPDLDNLLKMVYDCFNQVVWKDDSFICEVIARKEYSETPRTKIIIREVR